MDRMSRYTQARDDAELGFIGRGWLVSTASAAALAFAVAIGLGVNPMLATEEAAAEQRPTARANAMDSYQLIVDALLAPAFANAVPLRWADPRIASRCGRHTSVMVNNQALVPGALVPDGQFELAWQADGCHPPGAPEARIDGRVKLVVFREEWGFSAMIEPEGLRITSGGYERAVAQRGGASLARCTQSSQRVIPATFEDGERVPC